MLALTAIETVSPARQGPPDTGLDESFVQFSKYNHTLNRAYAHAGYAMGNMQGIWQG